MSIENKYPYTDFHELNLDWIVNKLKSIEESVEDWKAVNEIHFEGSWDITKDYKIWSVVNYDNDGYIAVKIVDKGIDITNREYWKPLIDYEDIVTRVEVLEGDFQALNNDLIALTSDVDTFKDDMYYKAGDTMTDNAYTVCNGFINNTKRVVFSLQLPKSLKNINSVSMNSMIGACRTVDGLYLDNSSATYQWVGAEDISISVTPNKQTNTLYIAINKSTPFANANVVVCPISIAMRFGLSFN